MWRVYGRSTMTVAEPAYCPYDVNEHYLLLTLLVMFLCAAQQILITVLKTLILSITCTAFILVTTLQHIRASNFRDPMSVFQSTFNTKINLLHWSQKYTLCYPTFCISFVQTPMRLRLESAVVKCSGGSGRGRGVAAARAPNRKHLPPRLYLETAGHRWASPCVLRRSAW